MLMIATTVHNVAYGEDDDDNDDNVHCKDESVSDGEIMTKKVIIGVINEDRNNGGK